MIQLGIPCKVNEKKLKIFFTGPYAIFSPIIDPKAGETQNKSEELIKIPFSSLKSIQTKTTSSFYIRISYSDQVIKTIIAEFETHTDRDLIKNLIQYGNKLELPCQEIDSETIELNKTLNNYGYKEEKDKKHSVQEMSQNSLNQKNTKFDTKNDEKSAIPNTYGNIPSNITSKNDIYHILLNNPMLLTVYHLLQATTSSFFNLLRLSFFFDTSNTKNVIDRRIEEITENEIDAVSRLNYKIGMVEENEIKTKQLSQKEIPFEPVYPFKCENEAQFEHFTGQNPESVPLNEILAVDDKLCVDLKPISPKKTEKPANVSLDLVQVSMYVYKHRNDESKREELMNLVERVDKILSDPIYDRVRPGFFFKQGNSEN